MKTVEELSKEFDLAERMLQEKQIEITLVQQGIDPEKVAMRDFDRIRRLIDEMDRINDRVNKSIAKVQEEGRAEVNKTVAELDAITNELLGKQAPEAKEQMENQNAEERPSV